MIKLKAGGSGIVPGERGVPPMENPITTTKRNRRKNATSTTERLMEAAGRARAEARDLPPGPAQRELLRRAREAETTAHLNDWLTSPGLQAPR
jgi:hypothetical protein